MYLWGGRVLDIPKGKSKSIVEFVDLDPTLCEQCGIFQTEDSLQGTSFVPVLENLHAKTKDHVFIQWLGGDNVVDERYSYAQWMQGGRIRAYMLFDHEINPEENKNRISETVYEQDIDQLADKVKTHK